VDKLAVSINTTRITLADDLAEDIPDCVVDIQDFAGGNQTNELLASVDYVPVQYPSDFPSPLS